MQVLLPLHFAEAIVTIVAFFLFFCFSLYIDATCVHDFFRKAYYGQHGNCPLGIHSNRVPLYHFVFSQESYCLKVTQQKTFQILKKVILLFPMNQTLQNVMH